MCVSACRYSGFADLLSSIISNVKATQRSHPGVYYQKAAFYAIDRQRLCHTLCTVSIIVEMHV